MELLGSEPAAEHATVLRAGDVAVLVEPGRGVTELREPRVHHALDVARASPGAAGDLVIVARDGGIHRFVPGAPPRPWWRGRDAGSVTATGVDEDRLLVATYRRFSRRVALIEGGAQRWSRRGIPTAHRAGAGLVVSWRHHKWFDTADAMSLVDLATGRDRWRIAMPALVAAIAAHPAQPAAAKLVIKLHGDRPRPPHWGPRWVGVVADRAWFVWDAGDLGSFVLGIDLATGALVAATPLQTVAPVGHLAGTKLHLLTAGRYEIFDLERDAVCEATTHLELPTMQCDLRCVLPDGRALLASRFGHLVVADPPATATRTLLHHADHYIGEPVLAGQRLHVVHHALGGRSRGATLAVLG